MLDRATILKAPTAWRDKLLEWFQPERRLIREYSTYLLLRHRDFDVKGLTTQGAFSLELEKVFVDLSLGLESSRRPKTLSSAFRVEGDVLADPLRPATAEKGRYTLWSFLTAKKMRERNFVVIGPPGSGKTTLLKHLTLMLAAQKSSGNGSLAEKLPILLFLRDHAIAIARDPQLTMEEVVQSKLVQWGLQRPSGWFEEKLAKGHGLILLDGLDEVADAEMRQQVIDWVQRQIKQYPQNRFVVTSRPFGYRSNPLPDVVVLEVRPFTIQQVQQFVQNWYLANEMMAAQRDDAGVRMKAQEGAADLLNRLRQVPNLLDMAVNPLLLTMIATVHRYRSSLPGRRVELYAEICEVFLGKRQQAKGLEDKLTSAQKQRVLQPLAYHMMHHEEKEILWAEALAAIQEPLAQVNTEITAESFLEMIANGSGLIVEREVGIYSFSHLTFQEYLTAAHIHDQHEEKSLLTQVEDSWWHEVIRLYAAQSDATNIIKACLARPYPSVKALTLAMECLEEAREVSPRLRTVFDKLAQSVEHTNPEVQRIAAEVRLALRLRRMLRVDSHKYVDNTFVTHAEYQLFINEERQDGRYRWPEHWSGDKFAAGQAHTAVVGVMPKDVIGFCQWLTEREAGGWVYRAAQPADVKAVLAAQANGADQPSLQPGYWAATKKGYHCQLEMPASLQNRFGQRLRERLETDWELHHRTDYQPECVNRARKLILARARQRHYTLLDLDRTFNRTSDLADARSRLLDRDSQAKAADLDEALENVLVQLQRLQIHSTSRLHLDEVSSAADAFIGAMNRIEGLATPHDQKAVQELLQQLRYSLDHAQSLAQNRELVVYQELTRALMMCLKYVRQLSIILDRATARARTRVRAMPFLYVVDLVSQLSREQDERNLRRIRYALSDYTDFYLDFALLEERRLGRLPALEGIRLVRERS